MLIYDLHSGNPRDIDMALTSIRKYNFEDEKILILISSVMIWNTNSTKLVEMRDEKDAEGSEEGEKEEGDAVPAEDEPASRADSEEEHKSEKGSEEGEGAGEGEEDKQKEEEKAKEYKVVPYTEEDFA